MLEGSEFCGLDDDTVTDDAHFVTALNLTLADNTTGDGTHLRDMEGLEHFERSCDFLFHLRCKETFHSRLDLIDSIIDDGIDTDIDFFGLRHLPCRTGRTDVKADDDSIRSRSEHDIAVADSTYGTVDDVDLDILRRELEQGVLDSLYGTVHIGFDDDIEFLEVSDSQTATDFLESDVFLRADGLLALELLTFVRYLARRLAVRR